METDNGWTGWVLGGVVTIITGLVGAVTTLWSRSESRNAQAIASLETKATHLEDANRACEKDRLELFGRVSKLEAKVSFLEGHTNEGK